MSEHLPHSIIAAMDHQKLRGMPVAPSLAERQARIAASRNRSAAERRRLDREALITRIVSISGFMLAVGAILAGARWLV